MSNTPPLRHWIPKHNLSRDKASLDETVNNQRQYELIERQHWKVFVPDSSYRVQ